MAAASAASWPTDAVLACCLVGRGVEEEAEQFSVHVLCGGPSEGFAVVRTEILTGILVSYWLQDIQDVGREPGLILYKAGRKITMYRIHPKENHSKRKLEAHLLSVDQSKTSRRLGSEYILRPNLYA